jgi:protoporphyrinogen oxidase
VVQANASLRFVQTFLLPERVPPGKALLRAGVRASNAIELDALARYAVERMQQLTGVPPLFTWAYLWPEADPRSRALPEHAAHMDVLDAALPPLVLVVGSDYRATRLPDRVAQGRAAARRIWAALHR